MVHNSVDAVNDTIPSDPSSSGGTGSNTPAVDKDDEGEGEGELPDHDERSIAKTRPPTQSDGIIELEELVRMMREEIPGGAISALGSSSPQSLETGDRTETFGDRGGLDGIGGIGRDEPAYTCYTPLFKLTLGESTNEFGRLCTWTWTCR